MGNRRYSGEEAYTFLSMTGSEEEVTHLSDSEYDPVDDSSSMTDSSDNGVVVPAKRSTSAAHPGELASTSGLVHPDGSQTSTAATRVQAGKVASTSSVPLPPRRQRQNCRAHSALPAAFANPNWESTTSAAPVLPPFTGQPGIQVETVDFTSLDFYSLFFTEDLYRSIVDQSNLYAGQYITANPQSSLAKDWKPITVSEFKTFLGLSLDMGIVKMSMLRPWIRSALQNSAPRKPLQPTFCRLVYSPSS
ncbi:hypothetical protein AB205_0141030 [Aquarana catesbeiana]|uniref:PiggyBac transposable element-derived protein domain-containing protein n=1 Tax=Aquarana catesbeiana TaxID=8400 RepID=A0A2G9QJA2_AQUCT|nr:hypothetical protein AB205_0141030 [Aquarana catesbeiana]